MPAYPELQEKQVWQIVLHLRSLSQIKLMGSFAECFVHRKGMAVVLLGLYFFSVPKIICAGSQGTFAENFSAPPVEKKFRIVFRNLSAE